jgi:hypothetical protein
LKTNVQRVRITSLCASLHKHVGGVVLFPTFGLYKRAEETATTVLPLDFEIRNRIILTVSSGYLYYGLEAGEWSGWGREVQPHEAAESKGQQSDSKQIL